MWSASSWHHASYECLAVLFAVLVISHVSGSPQKIKESKPNFVILFADDVSKEVERFNVASRSCITQYIITMHVLSLAMET